MFLKTEPIKKPLGAPEDSVNLVTEVSLADEIAAVQEELAREKEEVARLQEELHVKTDSGEVSKE